MAIPDTQMLQKMVGIAISCHNACSTSLHHGVNSNVKFNLKKVMQ